MAAPLDEHDVRALGIHRAQQGGSGGCGQDLDFHAWQHKKSRHLKQAFVFACQPRIG
jgi:hypothetical protein